MKISNLYEIFHQGSKMSDKIINKNNFTYFNTLKIINKYFKKRNRRQANILDIGCGVGSISFYAASKCFSVFGLDISQKAINISKKTAKKLNLTSKTQFQKVDIQKIKLEKNKYNYALCFEVLEHLTKDQEVIDKIYKSLRKGGILIMSTPSKNAPLFKWGFAREFDQKVGHLQRYSSKELSEKLGKSGFKILEIEETEGLLRNGLYLFKLPGKLIRFIKGPLVQIVMSIDRIFLNLFGGSQIFIVAKK